MIRRAAEEEKLDYVWNEKNIRSQMKMKYVKGGENITWKDKWRKKQ